MLRRVLQGYLSAAEAVDGVISDAELDWQTERQARFSGRQRPRRRCADELPLVEPHGPKGDRRRGGRQPRPRREALRRRLRLAAAAAAERRHLAVRGWRQPRAHARLGRAPHRRVRADPVQARDRAGARGAAALRPADDQQVLHPRPRAGSQRRRVPRRPGDAGLPRLVAQPRGGARPLRPRHLRERRARGARRRRRHHEGAGGQPQRGLLGRNYHVGRPGPSGGRGLARGHREPNAVRERAGQHACGHGGGVHEP